MTYDQQSLFLTYERLQAADLFILELVRTYENGIRAEGIAAAAKLATLARKSSLIVSCYTLGRDVQSPRYWDMGSRDSLVERTAQLLGADGAPLSDLDEIAALFPGMLAVPEQH